MRNNFPVSDDTWFNLDQIVRKVRMYLIHRLIFFINGVDNFFGLFDAGIIATDDLVCEEKVAADVPRLIVFKDGYNVTGGV